MKTSVFLTFGIITVNLIIAVLMLGSMSNDWYLTFLSFQRYQLNFLFALIGLYVSGYFIAIRMEKVMKNINYFSSIVVGIIGLFLVLIVGILSGSSVSVCKEISRISIEYSYANLIEDYIQIPLLLILVFGFIPTFLTGGLLGYLIKKN